MKKDFSFKSSLASVQVRGNKGPGNKVLIGLHGLFKHLGMFPGGGGETPYIVYGTDVPLE